MGVKSLGLGLGLAFFKHSCD